MSTETLSKPIWNVAIIEDTPVFRDQLKEYLEGESFSFGQIQVEIAEDFEHALKFLKQKKVDLIILDLFKGQPIEGVTAGLTVLEEWKKTGFAPIVFYTALDRSITHLKGPFIRVLAKQADAFVSLTKELEDLFANKIPHIYRLVNSQLEMVLRDYMWKFVIENWAGFEAAFGKIDLVRNFLKLLLNRMGSHLLSSGYAELVANLDYDVDPEPHKIADVSHPIEYYIKPPLSEDIRLGDIRKLTRADNSEFLAIIQWPSCDLVKRKDSYKTDTVLCLEIVPLDQFEEYSKWKKDPTSPDKHVKNLVGNRRSAGDQQVERYHFLPGAWDISAGVVDFQRMHVMTLDAVLKAPCLATLASPFAESLSSRFCRYLGRLGTPDLDIEVVIGGLKSPPKA